MSRTLQADEIPGAEALTQLRRLAESADQYSVQSDAELLELYVRRKDQQAVEALIKRYAPMVASVCRLTVHDPASAEDAFQATFVVLLKSASKVCRGNSLAAWLHGVAYRTACRVRAMRKKQQSNHNPSALEMHAAVDGDPLSELARQMELEALDRELEKLPERLRQPLIEHYLLGYTAPEIAGRMELSTSAVEGRLRRGRAHCALSSPDVALVCPSCWRVQIGSNSMSKLAKPTLGPNNCSTLNGCDLNQHNSTHPEFSSLVRGELKMLGTGTIKSLGAVAATLLAGTLVALAVSAHESPEQGPNNRGAAAAWNMAAAMQPQESPVVAQFGSLGSTGNPQPAVIASPASTPPPSNPSPAAAGPAIAGEGRWSNGHGHGDALQVGQMPAVTPLLLATDGPQVIQWQRPASDSQTDGTPAWLAGGVASAQAIEKNRQVLSYPHRLSI